MLRIALAVIPRDLMTYEAPGPEFAGGMVFKPWSALHKFLNVDTTLWLRTPNITPDATGVLTKYKTSEEFIPRFRLGRALSFSPVDWGPFSRMSNEDITVVGMYLNSLKPVKNDVGNPVITKEVK
jgi:hypothetical protein